MSAPRKLSAREEAALMAWYSQYQRALNEVRKLGTIKDKARQYGVRTETIHVIVKREQYSIRRKCRDAGVPYSKTGTSRAQ